MAKKDDAKKWINDFAANTSGTSVWPHLNRADVAAGALERIDNPDKIAQRDTNLCGLACFVRSFVTDKPDDYAQAIQHLFEFGTATITGGPKWWYVKPSTDLKNYALPAGAINPADWIIMASIRDNENWFLSYTSIDGGGSSFVNTTYDGVAAMTTPKELAAMFEKAGYSDVVANANPDRSKDLDNALEASAFYKDGYKVCLLIRANMLDMKTQDVKGGLTDLHWVMLASEIRTYSRVECPPVPSGKLSPSKCIIKDAKARVSFKVYTWGEVRDVPKQGELETNSFENNYYGYVACKY